MTFDSACSKILEILDQSQEAIMILQAVTLIVLNRRIGKLSKSSQNIATIPDVVEPEEVKKIIIPTKRLKEQTRERLEAALDLYFSDKEDLNDEERAEIESIQTFIDEVKNGKGNLS